jgi:homoserine kinase type II
MMLTSADIERALAHYDLGAVRRVHAATHGIVNETAFVDTSSGRLVVRRNQRRLGRASLGLRHRLLGHLRARGFPAPRLIAARSGENAVDIDGRLYEVFTFIDGDDFNPERPAHLSGAGAILARYHRAVADFADPPAAQPPRYVPSALHSLTERLLERDVMGELTEPLFWYDRRAADLGAALSDATYAALPHLLIHGDVHRDNLLFRGDAVAALLDFDQISYDARLVDLADALVGLAPGEPPAGWSPWGVYDGPLDPERAALLLGGYDETGRLSAAERAALPVMIETVWLQGNLRRVLLTREAETDYHLEVLEQGRWLSGWLAAQRGAIFG